MAVMASNVGSADAGADDAYTTVGPRAAQLGLTRAPKYTCPPHVDTAGSGARHEPIPYGLARYQGKKEY